MEPVGLAEWKANTSPFERVVQVSTTVPDPQPVSHIAETAAVEEATAQQYLERLVEIGVVRRTPSNGHPAYGPGPTYTRTVAIHDLLVAHDQDQLAETQSRMEEKIDAWRDRYNVKSPDELRAQAETIEDEALSRTMVDTAAEWALLRYRTQIVQDALVKARKTDSPPK